MNIDGQRIAVKKSQKELYEFLTQLENFEKLMPESIEKFEANDNSFILGLRGMPEIELLMKEKTEYSNVTLSAVNSSKLSFTLTANIEEISKNESSVQLKFQSSFNPLMSMIKKPLTKFIETLTTNIEKLQS